MYFCLVYICDFRKRLAYLLITSECLKTYGHLALLHFTLWWEKHHFSFCTCSSFFIKSTYPYDVHQEITWEIREIEFLEKCNISTFAYDRLSSRVSPLAFFPFLMEAKQSFVYVDKRASVSYYNFPFFLLFQKLYKRK